MAYQVRRFGFLVLALVPLAILAITLSPRIDTAESATYTSPLWSNISPSMECGLCDDCVCPAPSEWSPEGVSMRTGDLVWDHFLFSTPGKVGEFNFSLRWRAMVDGQSQLGNSVLPSWETTAEYEVLDALNPTGPSGHQVNIRRPSGRIDIFTWDGSAYVSSSCAITDALTVNGSSNYVLTDKFGNSLTFDSNGMPDILEDRNGNQRDFDYNGSLQLTDITDERGKSYTVAHNTDGFIESITDYASRTWDFTYDASGNLKTITTPTTPDQTSGITTTLNYDGSNRLSNVVDGRGNAVWSFTWVTTTRQIDLVTIDGDDVDFTFATGRTDRQDRNGNIHRTHYSGQTITKTDMYVASTAKYEHEYHWTGYLVTHEVMPRGNRIDYTYDGNNNLLTRRHKETDTASTSGSDLLHTWTFSSNFKATYTDPRGNQTTYGRDGSGNLTSVTYPNVTNPSAQTASETYTYNSDGQRLTHTDPEGILTTYEYHTSGTSVGLLHKVKLGPGGSELVTEYGRDTLGNVTTVTDPRGNDFTTAFDNLRRVTQTTAPSPLNYRVKFNYDGNGNRTKKEVENFDKDGNLVTANEWFTTTWAHDHEDRVTSIVEEIDASTTRSTSFTFDTNGNRIVLAKPEGNQERWVFDERDMVVEHTRGYGETYASTEEFEYDDNGNMTIHTDGRGADTTHTFDLFDRRIKTTDALGHYTEVDYDENGNVTEIRRKDSSNTLLMRSTKSYDTRNRLYQTSDLRKDPSTTYSDAVTVTERFKNSKLKTVTDANSNDTDYAYDNYGRLDTVTDGMGNYIDKDYDDNGNVTDWSITEIDGAGSVTHEFEATFDVLNRKLTDVEVDRTNSSNKYTKTYAYDSRSNRLWFVDAEGNPTRWTFDGLGRMIKRERALTLGGTIDTFTSAQVTEWGFDDNDRLITHTDDGTNDTTWTYDAIDRAIEMEYPDTSTVEYDYDKNGNVTEITDAAGNVIADTFDDLNRNTSRSVTLASGFLGTTSETRVFDGVGRMTSNADNDYKVIYSYGVIGMRSVVYQESQEYVGGTAYTETVTKTYDAVGNKATEVYPGGLSLEYDYNEINRLEEISDGTNTIATYGYIGSRLKTTTFQSGATQTNTYGGFRSEVTSIHHETSGASTIDRFDYGYDKNHDRLYERYGASGSAGDGFEYDRLRRLTTAYMGSVTPSNPSAVQYTTKIEYNMDDDGNRTSVVTTPWGAGSSTSSYTTNTLNQYTAVGGTSRSHDANGNLTDDGTYTYEYDYRNQIVKVRLKATSFTIADYKYDANGRRVEKALSGGTDRYVYSGHETIEVQDTSGTTEQEFVFRDVILGIVMLQQADILDHDSDANTSESTRSFYHTNALGSVMLLTDELEAEVVTYRYNPYGTASITVGGTPQGSDPLGQSLAYAGVYRDPETLLATLARGYSSFTGSFLQRGVQTSALDPSTYGLGVSSPLIGRLANSWLGGAWFGGPLIAGAIAKLKGAAWWVAMSGLSNAILGTASSSGVKVCRCWFSITGRKKNSEIKGRILKTEFSIFETATFNFTIDLGTCGTIATYTQETCVAKCRQQWAGQWSTYDDTVNNPESWKNNENTLPKLPVPIAAGVRVTRASSTRSLGLPALPRSGLALPYTPATRPDKDFPYKSYENWYAHSMEGTCESAYER